MKHSAVMAPTTRSGGRGDERRDHELGIGANGASEPGISKKGLDGRTKPQKPLTRILAGAPVDPAAHGTDVSCGQGGFPSGRVDLAGHAGGQDESFRSGGAGVQADPWAGGGGQSHEWLQGCGGGQDGHEAAGGAGGAAGAGVAMWRADPRVQSQGCAQQQIGAGQALGGGGARMVGMGGNFGDGGGQIQPPAGLHGATGGFGWVEGGMAVTSGNMACAAQPQAGYGCPQAGTMKFFSAR